MTFFGNNLVGQEPWQRRGEGTDIALLQGTATAVSGSTATVSFGDPTKTFGGVPVLASAGVSANDAVRVLRSGGTFLVIGKVAASPLTYTSGKIVIDGGALNDTLQIKGSGGNIALYWRDDQTKWFVLYATTSAFRVWDTVSGADRFTVSTGGDCIAASSFATPGAKIGTGVYGVSGDYAVFAHTAKYSVGNYAMLQDNGGATFLNAASTQMMNFRINNVQKMDINAGRIRIGADNDDVQTMTIRYNEQGDWTHSGHIMVSNVNESRIAFWAQGQGAAPIFKNWVNDFECRDPNDLGMTNLRALSFTTSRAAYKDSIRLATDRLSKADRKRKVKNITTHHFQRKPRETHCANCMGEGTISGGHVEHWKHALVLSGLVGRPAADVCPTCKGDPTWAPRNWKKDEESGWFGFLVEEMAEEFPELVGWRDYDPEGEGDLKPEAIELLGTIAVLWEEVKDLEERLDTIERKAE